MNYILTHQSSEGWLGADDITDGNAYWSKYPMLFALRHVSNNLSMGSESRWEGRGG